MMLELVPRLHAAAMLRGFAVVIALTAGWACSNTPTGPNLSGGSSESGGSNDFGDAPDPSFPTRLATNGARTRDGSKFWLGPLSAPPSMEADAKVTDRDDDNGLVRQVATAGRVLITFRAAMSQSATARTAYFNVLADTNGDGRWEDFIGPDGQAVSEWVVQNRTVTLSPGQEQPLEADFPETRGNLEVWFRGMLTDTPIAWSTSAYGTGSYDQGEVEDYRVQASQAWNAACFPNPLVLEHGQNGNITLAFSDMPGPGTEFTVKSTAGDQQDPPGAEIQVAALGAPGAAADPGFSLLKLFGPDISVTSTKVDPGPRTVSYTIETVVKQPGVREETVKCGVTVTHPPGEPIVTLSPPIVSVGTNLTITGQGFPPGMATKILRDPTDKEVYNITFLLDPAGTFTATLFIPGPTGTWLLIIRYPGGEVRLPFVVQN